MARTLEAEAALARRRERGLSRRWHLLLALATAVVLLWFANFAHAADDPLAGKWLGTIGSDKERIEAGLEFIPDADGSYGVRLTQPVGNYWSVDAGGKATRDGMRVAYAPLKLELTIDGDRLVGHFPGPHSAAELHRVDALPVAPPVPAVPALPAPRWQARLNGQVFASPVVADGVVYVGSTGGVFNAIDAATGETRWTFATGAPVHGDALVAGDAVYVASDRALHKLARADGRQVWRYDLGDPAARVLPHPSVFDWDWQGPAPLLADDVVFVGGGDGRFHAVDAATGKARWTFATKGRIRNGAAIDGERVVFGSADHFAYALDRRSGEERWRFDTQAEVDATPLAHAGKVYVGNRGPGLLKLDGATGAQDWRLYFWGSWVESTPVLHEGTLYIGASDLRRVSAVDPATGRVLWRTDVYGWSWGTPLVVGDEIWFGAAGGTPYFIEHQASVGVLDRATGKLLRRTPLPDTGGHQWGVAGSPARAGDSVIVATIGGSLLAYPLAP